MMNMRVREIGIENLGMIRLDPMFVKDNLNLDESDVALDELKDYRKMGGNSLVDLTLQGAGRNPPILKEISGKVGLNIVCGTGWYVVASHPSFVKKKSIYRATM
jgi:phosphotriesterase-related protein